MPSWGIVTTVKAPEDQVLAFIAHHLSLGAACIWIYFDDPDDPAYSKISMLPRVKAVRCTDWYWLLRGGCSLHVSGRQVRNCKHAQRGCKLDWLCHIDVDEFLFAPEPVADVLARVPATIPYLVMEPFEALHDPDAADDIFNGHHFRGLLNRQHVKLQPTIFGKSAPLLEKGALAHTLGKSFCRVGVKKLILDLHFASLNGEVLRSPFHPSLRLLHYHAQDPVAWKRALPFRLGKGGAYHSKAQQALHAYLTNANDQEISEFYANSMTLTPEKVALLRANDRLITTDLALRKKVAAMLEGRL